MGCLPHRTVTPYQRPSAAEAIDRLTAIMDKLRFAPQAGADGRQYRLGLHQCPFREVARQHQDVDCSLHLGLMQGALAQLRAPITADRLDALTGRSLCIAHMTSPRRARPQAAARRYGLTAGRMRNWQRQTCCLIRRTAGRPCLQRRRSLAGEPSTAAPWETAPAVGGTSQALLKGGSVCEYCGCQALATISELTREHELVADLASRARAALAKANVPLTTELARQIAAILAPHTAVEEDGLFPALAADFPAHIAALQTEHRHIEAVLGQALTGTPTDPAWPSRLTQALQLLREHILKEQDGVFPAALASLGTADWAAAEAVRARVGSLLPSADG
jgi:hypothetical protein